MSCPAGSNSGFIEITGPINQTDLKTITRSQGSPVTINIAPRTTSPMMYGNRIDEYTGAESTCRDLNSNTFILNDVQICSVTNKGYNIQKPEPKAELIASFLAKTHDSPNDRIGVLLCVYIYDSGPEKNADYINQIIESDDTANVVTLASVFKNKSFAYSTCFETIDKKKVTSNNLYIVVFPDGIYLTSQNYQKLSLKIGELKPYYVHPAIRGYKDTVRRYTLDKDGNKIITKTSSGIIYSTPMSSCSTDFKQKISYFLESPDIPSSSKAKGGKCKYYDTTQYKCVPFNKLSDLSGNIVIPGNTLDSILKPSDDIKNTGTDTGTDTGMDMEMIEDIIIGSVIGVIALVAIVVIYKVVIPKM